MRFVHLRASDGGNGGDPSVAGLHYENWVVNESLSAVSHEGGSYDCCDDGDPTRRHYLCWGWVAQSRISGGVDVQDRGLALELGRSLVAGREWLDMEVGFGCLKVQVFDLELVVDMIDAIQLDSHSSLLLYAEGKAQEVDSVAVVGLRYWVRRNLERERIDNVVVVGRKCGIVHVVLGWRGHLLEVNWRPGCSILGQSS